MSVYLIAEMVWKNTDWLADYLAVVPQLVLKHGGRYVVQTGEIERIEGSRDRTDGVVILEFPDRDAAMAFLNDPDYESPKAARLANTISETILVPTK